MNDLPKRQGYVTSIYPEPSQIQIFSLNLISLAIVIATAILGHRELFISTVDRSLLYFAIHMGIMLLGVLFGLVIHESLHTLPWLNKRNHIKFGLASIELRGLDLPRGKLFVSYILPFVVMAPLSTLLLFSFDGLHLTFFLMGIYLLNVACSSDLLNARVVCSYPKGTIFRTFVSNQAPLFLAYVPEKHS